MEFQQYQNVLIGVLVITFVNVTIAGRMCLHCDAVPQPLDCSRVTYCGQHEECLTEKSVSADGITMYNVGCADSTRCKATKRFLLDTVLCSACCNDSDICNMQPHCGAQEFKPQPDQTLCFSCPYLLADPGQCRQIGICGQDQFCSVVMTKNIADQFRYNVGCSSKSQCQFQNTSCCKDKLCNNQITMPRFKNPQENPTITMKYHTDEIVRICEALGNPKPHMVYEFAHIDPFPTNYYQSNGFLYIPHYSTENDGPYRCYATNKFGSVMKNFTLKGS